MKKIIIIGGGIAGLSAGIHAQQYGFESVIYEKHSIVGGQCTGWDRKGYHVDGCIHWLTGTKQGSDLYDLWCNVRALGDVDIIQLDNFGTHECNGTAITLWKDLDRLLTEWKQLSPEDTAAIEEFISDVRTVQSMDMPADMPVDMLPLNRLIKLMMSMKDMGSIMKKAGKMTCGDYAKRFKHPALQELFKNSMPEGFSMAAFIFSMGTFTSGNGAIPKGGSKAMALRMEKRFKELGGKVVCNISAEEIIIENKLATGVRFSDGTTVKADYVIAANDVKVTFDQLLKGKYKDKKFEMRYQNTEDYGLPTSIQVAFGVSADLSKYPNTLSYPCESFEVGGTQYMSMFVKNYAYEPSFAPTGCTLIETSINQTDKDYLYWERLHQDRTAYKQEKLRIARLLQERIEKRFPELIGKLILLDVATPMTYHRYTGAYHGAWMSFMMSPKAKLMSHSGKIKGLKNCYLTGQWLEPPGGLPVAVTTGKFTVLRICMKEKLLKSK
jgi:phytoene dehydrogenase-like protein